MKTATAVLAIVAAGTFAAAVTALPANSVPADDPIDLVPGLLPDDQSATPPADGSFLTGPSQAPACSGVTITPAQDAATVVDDSPAIEAPYSRGRSGWPGGPRATVSG